MRFLSFFIFCGLLHQSINAIYADGSIEVSSQGKTDFSFGYNKAANTIGGALNIDKSIDESKEANVQLGLGNGKLEGIGSLKINGEKANTTLFASGSHDLQNKYNVLDVGVQFSKYLESLGVAELIAAVNQDKEPEIGAALTKPFGNYSVKAGGLYNFIQKTFSNIGVQANYNENLVSLLRYAGSYLAVLKDQGVHQSDYIDFSHAENLLYNYTQKYLTGAISLNGQKSFNNGISYNFNGNAYNYSLISNAQLKYKKDNFEVIGGLSGVNGLISNKISKYVIGNYFTKIMEKYVTLQATLNFDEKVVPSFLIAISEVANSIISVGYNGNLRGIKNAVFGIITHTFQIENNPMTLTLRIGGLDNNILGIILVNGVYLGKSIKMQGYIYKDGNYNLSEVENLVDLQNL